jgi:hypothetical protein
MSEDAPFTWGGLAGLDAIEAAWLVGALGYAPSDSDAMLARKAAGFEPRRGRSAGRQASPKGGTMTTPIEEAVERVRKLVSCFDKFGDGHRMLGDSLLLGDLRTILNALSIDEERVASMRNTIILILDANYHTAISKAQSTADQIVQSIVGEG